MHVLLRCAQRGVTQVRTNRHDISAALQHVSCERMAQSARPHLDSKYRRVSASVWPRAGRCEYLFAYHASLGRFRGGTSTFDPKCRPHPYRLDPSSCGNRLSRTRNITAREKTQADKKRKKIYKMSYRTNPGSTAEPYPPCSRRIFSLMSARCGYGLDCELSQP